jgi:hypothetical protein
MKRPVLNAGQLDASFRWHDGVSVLTHHANPSGVTPAQAGVQLSLGSKSAGLDNSPPSNPAQG